MDETFVSAYPVAGEGASPKIRLGSITRGWKRFSKYLMIAAAVALFICPDPFTDILAFWLMAKAGVSMNLKVLARRTNIFFD